MKKTENKSGKSGMQVMKKLMAFIGNYKIFLGLSIVLAAVTVILQLYIPILFGDAIDEVVRSPPGQFPGDVVLSETNRILYPRFRTFRMDHEPDQQPYDVPHRARPSFPGDPSYPGAARCPIWISTAPETS